MNNLVFEKRYKELNKKQKDAVSSIEGPVMVVAGPGTGKTTILTLRIANILKETDTQPENILALTFTESAVYSMRQKLINIIGQTAYRVNIFTFHSFCNSLIEHYPEFYERLISSKPISESQQLKLIEEILAKGSFSLLCPLGDQNYYVNKIKSAISHLKKEGFTPLEFKKNIEDKIKKIKDNKDLINSKTNKLKVEHQRELKILERTLELSSFYNFYQKKMLENKVYDFDDMILETLEAFDNNEDFLLEQQEKFQYLLADEHQDTNHSQNKILEMIADFHESPNIFIVGDEKQAIFRFQGASLNNFLYFKDRFKNTKIIQLQENYRSTQTILDNAFNLILKNQTDPELNLTLKSNKKNQKKPIEITKYQTYDQENHGVVSKINNLIKKGIDPNEIAIIYRKNADAVDISNLLESFKIPFQIKSKQSIINSDDYLRLKIILNTISNPLKQENILSFLNLDFLKINFSDLHKISSKIINKNIFEIFDQNVFKEDELKNYKKISKIVSTLEKISKKSKNTNAVNIFESSINEFGFIKAILADKNSVERISIIDRIYNEIKSVSKSKNNYLISDFIDHLKTLENYSIDLETYISDLEKGISLMTAHGSKGLEFDYVFIIHASHNNWGNQNTKRYFDLPYVNLEIKNNQSIEDERRLFYVALTRARELVSISYSDFNFESKQVLPTQFISELDQKLIIQKNDNEHKLKDIFIQKTSPKENKNKITDREYIKKIFYEQPMSVTALNNYLKCPWRYFYSNLIRIPIETTPSLSFGNSIHSTLRWYVDNLQEKISLQKLQMKFEEILEGQSIDQNSKNKILNESKDVLDGFYKSFLQKIDKNQKYLTEYTINNSIFDSEMGEIKIKGNLDRIDFIDKNQIRIIDYKTTKPKSVNQILGKTKNDNADYYRQLIFYKMLIDLDKRWDLKETELIFVKPNDRGVYLSRKFEISEKEVAELKAEIIRVADEIINLKFWDKKCDEKDCPYCKMREIFN